MKKIFIFSFVIILLFNFTNKCISQTKLNSKPVIAIESKVSTFDINLNSKDYFRIIDGILLESDEKVPSNIEINDIKRINDTKKLRELNLVNFSKPYLIMNSNPDEIRNYIYQKSNITLKYRGINIPIVLNGNLVLPERYPSLSKLDSNKIIEIRYTEIAPSTFLHKRDKLPFGVIIVSSKK